MPSHTEMAGIFGQQVCETLGLDPNRVRSITIHVDATDVLVVSVVMYANAEELAAARQVLLANISKVQIDSVQLGTGFTIEIEPAQSTSLTDETETCA